MYIKTYFTELNKHKKVDLRLKKMTFHTGFWKPHGSITTTIKVRSDNICILSHTFIELSKAFHVLLTYIDLLLFWSRWCWSIIWTLYEQRGSSLRLRVHLAKHLNDCMPGFCLRCAVICHLIYMISLGQNYANTHIFMQIEMIQRKKAWLLRL